MICRNNVKFVPLTQTFVRGKYYVILLCKIADLVTENVMGDISKVLIVAGAEMHTAKILAG